jgi:tetratricopeptide (TPR) repeat protein
MICPNCHSNISDKRKRCDRCGTDLTYYKKILRTSDFYYNNGLARAKVRDLSGAVNALKNCLALNKLNTDARNLLGLVYFEMGETVAALSEWVISKHFQPVDNDADEYINAVQSNPTKLDNLNQAIKRYNNALTFAKQGSDDLAIIQLKKVVVLNPHFIRAYQLLALLCMKNNDNEPAKKYLIKAGKIDVSNTTTLKYMRELEAPESPAGEQDESEDAGRGLTSSIMPVTSYKEDRPNIMAYVNLVLGVIIGLAIMAILVIPSLKKDQANNNNKGETNYGISIETLQEKEDEITALLQENSSLKQEISSLKTHIDNIVIPETNPTLYDPLLTTAGEYMDELIKPEEERELVNIAEKLMVIDTSEYESQEALALLELMRSGTYPAAARAYYDIGHDQYGDYKYEDALVNLRKSYELDPTNVSAIYFIARTYHRMNDFDNARLFYEIVITDFPDSNRADDAEDFLSQID